MTMTRDELLTRYAAGRGDFIRANVTGEDLAGANLVGANLAGDDSQEFRALCRVRAALKETEQ